jgi:glycosyltransferase involved in cell wall biosynthesis
LRHDVRRDHQLVLTCSLEPATEQHWRDHAARRGLTAGELVLTGYLDDTALRALYQRCRLFVMNSHREGFGLPVLEAARCGAIAITADNSSLPEVLDEPESLFPTGDTDALAARIDTALRDESLRRRLATASSRAAARFSWAAVADATLDAYQRLQPLPDLASRRRARPATIAMVGPFAPASSGIADYNERVATALAPLAALDCFAEVDPPYTRGSTAGRRFAIGTFGRAFSPTAYDSVIYTLGNSRFHRQTVERALAYPGIVWLHDACLAGLYLTRAGLYLPGVATEEIDFDAAEAFMRAALARCDGDDRSWLGDDWWRPEAWVDAGVLMLGEVLRTARSLIVSSEEARRIVVAHGGAGLDVHVVPLAVPPPPPLPVTADADAIDDEDGRGSPWVVSLGVVSTVKRIDDLVRAFARVRDRTGARLAVVGNVDLVYANTLLALADELGVGGDVVVTGLVPPDEYAAWVQRASAVVQLRTRSVGEGSATVTDALAAARAVITNVGSATELPDGVVDRVAVDVDVDTLAGRLERALLDRDHREALERAAARFATTHSFPDVAQRVLEIVGRTAEPAYPTPLAATA